MARAATDHARAERVAQVAAGQFSESVLQREAADPAVLRLAQAHDPLAAEDLGVDRQVQLLADRLNARAANPDAMQQARDLDCLTDAVYYEARGETKRGQQAVATVVLNRVKNPNFPKTVCGVVFQRAAGTCQFSFACDGSMRRGREADAWEDARKVAARALSGYVLRDVGSATHFHTLDVSPGWGPKMLRVATVGLHVFYRFNPHARDAIQAPEPQHAVFTSTDANLPPTLRIATAMTVKSDAAPPVAQAAAGKDAKAVVKDAPQGLSKAVAKEAPQGLAKTANEAADLKPAKTAADTTAS